MSGTVGVVAFNAASAMPRNTEGRAERIARAAAAKAVIAGGVEMDDATSDVLDDALWETAHPRGTFTDGTFLGVRSDRASIMEWHLGPGAPASPVNDPRSILRAVIRVHGWPRSLVVGVLHCPRPGDGGWDAHQEMMRNARDLRADLLLGDFNVGKAAMERAFPGRQIRSDRVMHQVAGSRIVASKAEAYDLLPDETGDDHRAVKTHVHLRRGRR